MKNIIEILKTRRSIRKFQSRQVDPQILDQILEAGTYAPTGMNCQSPVMVVLQDSDKIRELSRLNANILGKPEADPFYGAPTVVVVLADRTKPTYREDGCLVMGNLLNAAHGLGIGSCWIHRAKEEFETPEGEALLQSWGLSKDYAGIGHCILGYAEGGAPAARERKTDYVIRG